MPDAKSKHERQSIEWFSLWFRLIPDDRLILRGIMLAKINRRVRVFTFIADEVVAWATPRIIGG